MTIAQLDTVILTGLVVCAVGLMGSLLIEVFCHPQ